jgi:hypothetical protein
MIKILLHNQTWMMMLKQTEKIQYKNKFSEGYKSHRGMLPYIQQMFQCQGHKCINIKQRQYFWDKKLRRFNQCMENFATHLSPRILDGTLDN